MVPVATTWGPHHYWFPDAPLDQPGGGRQWYRKGEDTATQVAESGRALSRSIAAARALVPGVPWILAGFSQGSVMTLDHGLSHADAPVALVAVSGFLMRDPAPLASRPVLLVHGTEDDVVPLHLAHTALARLGELGVPVEYLERPGMEHRIDLAAGKAIAEFIARSLAPR